MRCSLLRVSTSFVLCLVFTKVRRKQSRLLRQGRAEEEEKFKLEDVRVKVAALYFNAYNPWTVGTLPQDSDPRVQSSDIQLR